MPLISSASAMPPAPAMMQIPSGSQISCFTLLSRRARGGVSTLVVSSAVEGRPTFRFEVFQLERCLAVVAADLFVHGTDLLQRCTAQDEWRDFGRPRVVPIWA